MDGQLLHSILNENAIRCRHFPDYIGTFIMKRKPIRRTGDRSNHRCISYDMSIWTLTGNNELSLVRQPNSERRKMKEKRTLVTISESFSAG